MKNTFLLLLLLNLNAPFAKGQNDSVVIRGKITDFENRPVANALVMLKGTDFSGFVDTTYSDSVGQYAMTVKSGKYSGLAIVNMDEYAKTKLEFWAFEIPAFDHFQIDARYDKLEVYGVNVFQIQGGYPGYTIYFRPMSLSRFLRDDAAAPQGMAKMCTPADHIEVQVEINDSPVKVNTIQQVNEFAGQQSVLGYLIHTDLGKSSPERYDKIRLVITDKENGDKGEAIYFKEKE